MLTSSTDMAGPVLIRARDDVAVLRELLAVGANPREQVQTNTIALPVFFLAAREGQLDAMRAFVEKGMDPRHVGARGTTALTLASGSGSTRTSPRSRTFSTRAPTSTPPTPTDARPSTGP